MPEWFPEIQGWLTAHGTRLLKRYPEASRTILGSALAALVAWSLLGAGYTVGLAISAAARAVQNATLSASSTAVEPPVQLPLAPLDVPAKTPQAATAEKTNRVAENAAQQNARPAPGPKAPPLPPDAVELVRDPVNPLSLPYKEGRGASIGDATKQIDFALLQTVVRLGLDQGRMYFLSTEYRGRGDGRYPFQRLRFYLPKTEAGQPDAVIRFINVLDAMLEAWSERALLTRTAPNRLTISVDGTPTHEFWVETVGEEFLLPPADAKACLTIVIDDMGGNLKALHELLALNIPVTVSIWPLSAHAAATARAAHAAGREVLIHQPMEPVQAPFVDTGPGGVTLAMPEENIRRTLLDNIKRVPHASGLNNHMGSRFTQDQRGTALVCDILAPEGLFALDSVTHKQSVLYDAARQRGLSAYRRAVFLDDGPRTVDSVLRELRAAEAIALKTGQAVAIGHPHPETLTALKRWTAERNADIHVVPLRHLAVPVETMTPEPIK